MACATSSRECQQQTEWSDSISFSAGTAKSRLISLLPPLRDANCSFTRTTGFLSSPPVNSLSCMPFIHPAPTEKALAELLSFAVQPQRCDSSNSRESLRGSHLRIATLENENKVGGPAFVGRVFSTHNVSGNGTTAVSPELSAPFILTARDWIKKLIANITKREKHDPLFSFFLDLCDAASHAKKLGIPSAEIASCRLDIAYIYFTERPGLFEFVPNRKQVRAATELLKSDGNKRTIRGVPVFGARNLDIAIATADGSRWYTPYFFDKATLDAILEESVDQHFRAMIGSRRLQRLKEALLVDDNPASAIAAELAHEVADTPEMHDMMGEMAKHALPMVVGAVVKAVHMHVMHGVDRAVLGNRWFRWVIGVQPRFPYIIDSFERRSGIGPEELPVLGSRPDPFLPRITMLGVSRSESEKLNNDSFRRRLQEVTDRRGYDLCGGLRYPLFVADIGGGASSGLDKTGLGRWVRSAYE